MSRNKIFLLIKLFVSVTEFLLQILYSDFLADENYLILNYLETNLTIFMSSLKCRQEQLTMMRYANMLAKKLQTLQEYWHGYGCQKICSYGAKSVNHKPIVILILLWFQSEYSWNQIFQLRNYVKFLFPFPCTWVTCSNG